MSSSSSNQAAKPFFSVLIPSYNRPEDISRNIASILAEDFKDVEIIISDDCSPRAAEVRAAIEPFLVHENVRFFQQQSNLREPANKNFLVQQSRGEYSIILGDDDYFISNALSKLKAHIDQKPGYDLYCFGYKIVDENDRTIVSRQSPRMFEISDKKTEIMEQMFAADMLPLWLFHPNTYCCKNGVENDLSYREDVGIGEDLYFIFDFLLSGKRMLVLPEMMFHWRKLQDLSSGKQVNQSLAVLADFVARKKMFDKLQSDERVPAALRKFMDTRAYRIRFLYNAIISDSRITPDLYYKEGMENLNMSEFMLQEFLEYAQPDKLDFLRKKHRCEHVLLFIKLVGIGGLVSVLKVIYQRIANNLHIRRL